MYPVFDSDGSDSNELCAYRRHQAHLYEIPLRLEPHPHIVPVLAHWCGPTALLKPWVQDDWLPALQPVST